MLGKHKYIWDTGNNKLVAFSDQKTHLFLMLLLGNLGKPQWVYTALDHLSSKTGVPKLSPSMYPFSISIDEHVPLNMSARRILSRKGPIVDFPGVGQNIFAGGNKCGKIWFSPLETKKRPFYQKILYDEKTSNFKILGRPWSPLLTPMPLKLLMAKRLGKITKIYLPIRIKWFKNNIHWYLF